MGRRTNHPLAGPRIRLAPPPTAVWDPRYYKLAQPRVTERVRAGRMAAAQVPPATVIVDPRIEDPIQTDSGLVDWWASEVGTGTPAQILDVGDGLGGGNILHLTNSGLTVPGTGGKWLFPCVGNGASQASRADEADLRLGATDVTFACWVYLRSFSLGVLFEKAGSFYCGPVVLSRQLRWDVWLSGERWSAISPDNLPLNTWFLIIVDWNATLQTVSWQINGGQPLVSGVKVTETTPADGDFIIMRNLSGRMEQLMRWNRLLDESERAALLNDAALNMIGVTFAPASGDTPNGWEDEADLVAPTALGLTVAGSTATLSWMVNSVTETGFEIYRSRDNGGFVPVGAAPLMATTYVDTNIDTANHTYDYKVRAVKNGLTSAFSNQVGLSVQPAGGTYLISGGFLYLANQETYTWHAIYFDAGVMLVGAAVSVPTPDASVPVSDVGFEFSEIAGVKRFRLSDGAEFRDLWAEGGTVVYDESASAASAGTVAAAYGVRYKFENGGFYLYDDENEEWLLVSVVGAAGLEQLQLG